MIKDIARTLGGIAAAAVALSLTACDGATLVVNGMKGVPLAQLDLSQAAPEEISLLGPDNVHVVQGDKLGLGTRFMRDEDEGGSEWVHHTVHEGWFAVGSGGRVGLSLEP